jgi:hypothetical protein
MICVHSWTDTHAHQTDDGPYKEAQENMAAGPDGIQRRHLARTEVKVHLTLFYNLILSGLQPSQWGHNRTTLIPNPGKDPTLVDKIPTVHYQFPSL